MSDHSSQDFQSSTSTQHSESVSKEKQYFEEVLAKSHEQRNLQNNIYSGLLTEIRVIPKIYYFSCTLASNNSHIHSSASNTLDPSKITQTGTLVSQKTPPFVDVVRRKDLNDIGRNSISSVEGLYMKPLEENANYIQVRVNPSVIQSSVKLDESEDMFITGHLSYAIIGKLDTEQFMEPKEIILEDNCSVTDINSFDPPSKVDFRVSSSGSIEFRENKKSAILPSKTEFSCRAITRAVITIILLYIPLFLAYYSLHLVATISVASVVPVWYLLMNYFPVKLFGKAFENEFIESKEVQTNSEVGVNLQEMKSQIREINSHQKLQENIRTAIDHLPRSVTVEVDDSNEVLTATVGEKDIIWSLKNDTSEPLFKKEVVDFFINFGFDKEKQKFETTVVRSESEHTEKINNGLMSDCGNWILSPETIDYHSVIDKNTIRKA